MFNDPRDPRLIAQAACVKRDNESDYAAFSRLAGLCRQFAEELAEIQGNGQTCQLGCTLHEMHLGDSPVLIEYDDDAGVVCGMLVNGKWSDPRDCVSAEQIARWTDRIDESARIARQDLIEHRGA